MTALERIAREIGVALSECGAGEGSPLVGELAETLEELGREPFPRGAGRHRARRRAARRPAPASPRSG